MSKFVRMIFGVLIGVNVAIVGVSAFVELINSHTYGNFLRINIDTAVEAGCNYFSQESYKSLSGNYYGNVSNIMGSDGSLAASGRFYEGSNAKEIYDNMFVDNVGFERFKRLTDGSGRHFYEIWGSLAKVNRQINPGNRDTDFQVSTGVFDPKNLVTPANIGVAYLDRQAVTKMIKWNIAALVSQGSDENIKYNDLGDVVININGYEVDIDSLRVNITYEAVTVDSQKFEDITHLSKTVMMQSANGDSERETICVAKVTYSINVRYVGITPIKNIVEYYSRVSVDGLDGSGAIGGSGAQNIDSRYAKFSSSIYYYVIR